MELALAACRWERAALILRVRHVETRCFILEKRTQGAMAGDARHRRTFYRSPLE